MLDYTQRAFATPPDIFDPIPSVADYIDQYRVNNEAWYSQWAWPHGPNPDVPGTQIWGSRPTSFERRAPYIPPEPPLSETEIPVDVLPPVLGDLYGDEDRTVRPEDRPVGALVRDVGGMTVPELVAEREALLGPMGYAGSVASTVIPGGLPFLPGAMSRRGVDERVVDIDAERLFRAPQASSMPSLFLTSDAMLSPPPPVVTEQQRAEERVRRDQNAVQEQIKREVVQKQKESRSDADRDDSRGYGGGSEVGAGGWAGSGGL